VKVTPQLVEGAALAPKTKNGEYDLLYQGWGFQGVPSVYGHCSPASGDTRGTPAIRRSRSSSRRARPRRARAHRKTPTTKIQKIINDTLPIYPFLKFKGLVAINKRVTGFGDDAIWMMLPSLVPRATMAP